MTPEQKRAFPVDGRAEQGDDEPMLRSHPLPLRHQSADTIFFVEFDDEGGYGKVIEFLWATTQPDESYKVCCVPAFVYDISLGDIVLADSNLRMTEIVGRSGHSCLRIWSEEGWYVKFDVVCEVNRLGGHVEPCTFKIWAIDAPNDAIAWRIRNYLSEQQSSGRLEFEIGRWAAGDNRPDDPS